MQLGPLGLLNEGQATGYWDIQNSWLYFLETPLIYMEIFSAQTQNILNSFIGNFF